MRTTHGCHIPGTRLGDNPPIKPARCGGIFQCPDCMLEAAAIPRLNYSRDEYFDEHTLTRVYGSLCEAGATPQMASDAISVMLNNGILFRERK